MNMRVKLSELGTVITGNTPSKQEQKYWTSSDIPFIKPDIISQNEITELQSANEYVSDAARSKARIVGKGVVLVTCIGTIGKICLTGRECAFNQQINAIVPNEKVLPEYLAYCIYYNRYKLAEIANAPVVPIINKSQFEEFYVSIEKDVELQRKILLILRRASALVSYRQQQLQKLDELVKARFVEMFENGMSPLKNIYELCSYIVDCPHTTPKYEGELKNPAIRTSEIKKGTIVWDTMRYVSDDEYLERTARLVPKAGDIVYGREGTFGNAAILPEGYKFCLGQRVMLLRPDYFKCTSEYLLYAVISDYVYSQALEKNNASTVAHVNVKDVKRFKIPLPPLSKQKQFARFIKQIDKSKTAVQKALDEAQLLFDSLMQKYFE